MDREALPKGERSVSFAQAEGPVHDRPEVPAPVSAPSDGDDAMGGEGSDAEGPAGELSDGDDAGDAGVRTPVWPPADATLGQLEEWLDALRRLPEDDIILSRQALLGRRINELRKPLPAQPAEPLTLVLRAKRVSDKRRRQLRRFSGLLDELLAQEVALKAALLDAHATVDTTRRLL